MTDPRETESIVSLKLYSSLFSRNFVEIERLLRNLQSGIRNLFAYGIWNPGKFCLWNPESWGLESRIQLHESGIPQYSINDWNPESKSSTDKDWNPACTAWNTESRPLLGRAYFQIYPGRGHWGIKRRRGWRPYSTLFSRTFTPRYE